MSRNLHIVMHKATVQLHRAVISQQFVYRRVEHIRVVPEPPQLFGVLQQRSHPVAYQIARGLVACHKQQDESAEQFFIGEPVAFILYIQQRRNHIVLRFAPPLFDYALEILIQFLSRALHAPNLVVPQRRLYRKRNVVRPVLEPVHILRRHAEHLRNHGYRHRKGEAFDEVEPVLAFEFVQHIIDYALHPGMKLPYGAWSERLGDERSQPCMVWRVVVQHAPVFVLDSVVLREPPMVAQHRIDIFIPRQHPPVYQAHPVYGVARTQPVVCVIRVAEDAGGSRVIAHARLHAFPREQRGRQNGLQRSLHRPGHNRHSELSMTGM